MNNGSEQANELTHCSKFIFEAAFYAVTNIAAYGGNFSCPVWALAFTYLALLY